MKKNDNVINICYGVSARFKLVTHKGDADGNPIPGTTVERTGWIKNLITDRGMNCLGDTGTYGFFMRGCTVGTGSTTPAFTDTALTSRVANAIPTAGTQGRDLVATPNFIWCNKTYRFGTGVAAGNLAEVGLVAGQSDNSSANGALNAATPLSTHALIVDGGGLPTTVTVLSDEILDVIYEVRMNIPAADVTGVVTIAGVNYDFIVRPWRIDAFPGINIGGWGLPDTTNTQLGFLANFRQSAGHGENAVWCGAAAEITTTTGVTPAGTKIAGDTAGMSRANAAYTVNSWYRDCTQSFGLGTSGTGANTAGGIGVHSFTFTHHSFQVNLNPHVPKDHTKLYSLTMRVSWSRA